MRYRVSREGRRRVGVIRILLAVPRFVFLDRISAVMSPDEMQKILRMLRDSSITYINCAAAGEPCYLYDAILECKENGAWRWTPITVAEPDANEHSVKAPP